jgi:drug/metabolite transporter (DMT)-like permease
MQRRPTVPYFVLIGSVMVTSTAAILITLMKAEGVQPLAIAAGRVGVAALILTPLAWSGGAPEIRRLSRRDLLLALLGGFFLAIHFAAWVWSLAFTSVASAMTLVSATPIFVALSSYFIWGERLTGPALGGVLLSMLGSALIGFSDSSGGSGSNPLLGDFLALVGALFLTGYMLVGRDLRRHLRLLPYIWLVYTSSAVFLTAGMLLAGQTLLGFSLHVNLLLLALAIGPQLIGHSAVNWSIKYLSATFIAVTKLGEPILTTLLALAILSDQRLKPLQIAGGIVLLIGIGAATLTESRGRQQAMVNTALQDFAAS